MASNSLQIIYDPDVTVDRRFYDPQSDVFLSNHKAQSLIDSGAVEVIVGQGPSHTPSSSSLEVEIIYDSKSPYWEQYYQTQSDTFLSQRDALILEETGLASIKSGKIPYVVIKEGEFYFDVVENKEISEEMAMELVSSGVAVLKNKTYKKKESAETMKEPVDEDEKDNSLYFLATEESYGRASTEEPLHSPSSWKESTEEPVAFPSSTQPSARHQTSSQPSSQPSCQPPSQTSSQPSSQLLRQSPRQTSSQPPRQPPRQTLGQPSSQCQEESLLEKVAPIAAGVAVAGVAIAGIGFALFGGKSKKGRR